eukprot:TCALIF_13638-PA protein Name:"Similar to Chst8 Carbohydrate sulfotransferase 8 (Mus musculus)" AED:0.15 eAED:0.15 QI:0/0.5/0/0.66/1/1/3/0/366
MKLHILLGATILTVIGGLGFLGSRHFTFGQRDALRTILPDNWEKFDRISDPRFRALFLSRKRRLRDTCNQIKAEESTRFSQKFSNLYTWKDSSFLWCPVFKAGTSNWMANFFHLAPLTQEERSSIENAHESMLDRAKAVRFTFSGQLFHQYKKSHPQMDSFIWVRHPFYRLVSAFRDKLERLHGHGLEQDYFYALYGRKIVEEYRDSAISRFGSDAFSHENHFGAPVPFEGQRVPEQPIFWEFVQWLLKMKPIHMDEHWSPIMETCSPCIMNYEMILKLENHDVEEIILEEYLGISARLEPPTRANSYGNNVNLTEDEITRRYLDTLSIADVQKLFALYRHDFEIFDYSFSYRGLDFQPNSNKKKD